MLVNLVLYSQAVYPEVYLRKTIDGTRKMDPERKAFIQSLLEHYQPKDAQDVQDMLKDLLGETLQGMLEAEMDDHLGYSKYDYKNKETDDSRNGYSPKTVTSSIGTIDLDIPRDRKGDFKPQIIKKHQTDIVLMISGEIVFTSKAFLNKDFEVQEKKVELAQLTEHFWDEGEVTTEPTVEAEGVKTYTCSVCGETKTETIPKLTKEEDDQIKADIQVHVTE